MFDIKKLTILCKYDILKYVNFLVYKITYMLSKNFRKENPNGIWHMKKSRSISFEVTTDGDMVETKLRQLDSNVKITSIALDISNATWMMIYRKDITGVQRIFLTEEEKIANLIDLPKVNEKEMNRIEAKLNPFEEKSYYSLIELEREINLRLGKTAYNLKNRRMQREVPSIRRIQYDSFPYPHLETGEYKGTILLPGMNTIMISKIYADVRNFRYKSISEMMMSLRRYVPECKFPVYKIKISKKDTMKGTFFLDLEMFYEGCEYFHTYTNFWEVNKE